MAPVRSAREFPKQSRAWSPRHPSRRQVDFIDDARDNSEQGIDFLLTDGHFSKSLAASRADFG